MNITEREKEAFALGLYLHGRIYKADGTDVVDTVGVVNTEPIGTKMGFSKYRKVIAYDAANPITELDVPISIQFNDIGVIGFDLRLRTSPYFIDTMSVAGHADWDYDLIVDSSKYNAVDWEGKWKKLLKISSIDTSNINDERENFGIMWLHVRINLGGVDPAQSNRPNRLSITGSQAIPYNGISSISHYDTDDEDQDDVYIEKTEDVSHAKCTFIIDYGDIPVERWHEKLFMAGPNYVYISNSGSAKSIIRYNIKYTASSSTTATVNVYGDGVLIGSEPVILQQGSNAVTGEIELTLPVNTNKYMDISYELDVDEDDSGNEVDVQIPAYGAGVTVVTATPREDSVNIVKAPTLVEYIQRIKVGDFYEIETITNVDIDNAIDKLKVHDLYDMYFVSDLVTADNEVDSFDINDLYQIEFE